MHREMMTGKTLEIPLDGQCADWVMPNASGGYWRFNLSDENWAALTANFDALGPREQLSFVDSIAAAFRAGDHARAAGGNVAFSLGEPDDLGNATARKQRIDGAMPQIGERISFHAKPTMTKLRMVGTKIAVR